MVRHVSHLQHLLTLAERVLACYDLSDTANAVFHVAVPSGRPQRLVEPGRTSDGAEYALRLCPPGWHRTQSIAEALQWLLALRRDTDLVVPEPVPACDGTLIQAISDPDTPGPWHGVLLHWGAGECRTATLTPPDLERVGTCMARLHQHAAAFVTAQHPPLTRRARFCDVRAWKHGFPPAVAVYAPRDLAVCAVAAPWVQTACQAVEERHHGGDVSTPTCTNGTLCSTARTCASSTLMIVDGGTMSLTWRSHSPISTIGTIVPRCATLS